MDFCRDQRGDLMLDGDLMTASDLLTRAEQALLVNGRAANQQQGGDTNLRGWFGDDTLGSLIWTLVGRPVTADLLKTAEGYARQSLSFLVDEGEIDQVEATATHSAGIVDLNVRLVKGGEVLGLVELNNILQP